MTIVADWSKLTEKQRNTIRDFMSHGNKLRAYSTNYDVSDPKSPTTLRNCYNFFRKPHIKVIINQIQEEAVKRAEIDINEIIDGSVESMVDEAAEVGRLCVDATWVLRRAALLADFNIRKFLKVDDQGNAIYDFSKASDDDWYCIQEYTVDEIARGQGDGKFFVDRVKLKTYDKLAALKLVGQHIDVQAFKEQVEQKITGSMTVRTLDDFYDSETESET